MEEVSPLAGCPGSCLTFFLQDHQAPFDPHPTVRTFSWHILWNGQRQYYKDTIRLVEICKVLPWAGWGNYASSYCTATRYRSYLWNELELEMLQYTTVYPQYPRFKDVKRPIGASTNHDSRSVSRTPQSVPSSYGCEGRWIQGSFGPSDVYFRCILPMYTIHTQVPCTIVPLYLCTVAQVAQDTLIHTVLLGLFFRLFCHTPESGNCVFQFDWFQSKRLLGCVSHSNYFFTPNIICPNRDNSASPAQIPITGCKKKGKMHETEKK